MKTNAMRILDSKGIYYTLRTYPNDVALSGVEVAKLLKEDAASVFKTLVVQGKSHAYYVCVIPVLKQLDLKVCAKLLHEKSIDLIPQKDLLPLTGYVHGGCSPFGMKKVFKTVVDVSVQDVESAFVSAGKIGFQLELDLKKACPNFGFEVAKITT